MAFKILFPYGVLEAPGSSIHIALTRQSHPGGLEAPDGPLAPWTKDQGSNSRDQGPGHSPYLNPCNLGVGTLVTCNKVTEVTAKTLCFFKVAKNKLEGDDPQVTAVAFVGGLYLEKCQKVKTPKLQRVTAPKLQEPNMLQ